MTTTSRRRFLKEGVLGVTAASLLPRSKLHAAGANERVRIAVIGCGGQGNAHIRSLKTLDGTEVVYVCDVDQERLAAAAKEAGAGKPVADFRVILDDQSIDAITIATPDHWHAPIALMALDAGKHVYVEKPCCHNVREGQLLFAAAKKSGKSVAHGTQSRSSTAMQQAIQLLHEGVIGDVLVAKCWNWQKRDDIGRQQPSAPPVGVDYDMWVGPAEWMPFQANRFHYDWHWWYNFGCGDLGNDGIHDLDYTLWGLGVETDPAVISGVGGKYFFDDDQEFPDTQQVTFEYPGDGKSGNRKMLIFEMRLWSTTYPFNVDSGAEYYGTKGKMFLSKRGKFEVQGPRNAASEVKLVSKITTSVADHQQNWLECIKSGREPNANIEAAVRSATAVHLGNIATRLQRTIRFDPATQTAIDDEEANALLGRKYRADGHWGIPHEV
jgi:predicted dehydrogenase